MFTQFQNIKFIKTTVLFFALIIGVPPQTIFGQGSSFFAGAAIGGNFSKYHFKDQYEDWGTKSSLGLGGGLKAGVSFGRLTFITGLGYSKKSGKYTTPNFDKIVNDFPYQGDYTDIDYEVIIFDTNSDGYQDRGFFTFNEKQKYLTIPLMVRAKLFGDDFGVTAGAGIQFNIGLGADISGNFQTIDATNENLVETTNISSMPPAYVLYYDELSDVVYGDPYDGQITNFYTSKFFDYDFGNDLDNEYKKVQTTFLIDVGCFKKVGEHGQLHFNLGLDIGLGDIYNNRYKETFRSLVLEDIEGDKLLKSTTFTISYEHHFDFGDKY